MKNLQPWCQGILAAALLTVVGPAAAATACKATYVVTNQWNNGFTAAVKIVNAGDALDGWKVTWDMPNDQVLAGLWNGQAVQSGARVSVTDATWNAKVAAGGAIEFGFNASHTGTNDLPVNIAVNGVVCDGQAVATPQPKTVACEASYKIDNQWNTGATVSVVIKNKGSNLNGWTVAWDMPNGQTIASAWNAQATQSQAHVAMKNLDWNRAIATGAEIQFGFNLNHSGNNGVPGNLSVNGVACSGQSSTTPNPNVPAAPSALTAAIFDNSEVNLVWTDQSSNEQGFRVERRVSGGAWAVLGNTAAGVGSYRDANVSAGTAYEYRVSAFNAAGGSAAVTTTATLLTAKLYGQQQYDQQCASCHGADGKGRKPLPAYTSAQSATLAHTIATTMPPRDPVACQGNCSTSIAAYLLDLLAAAPADDEPDDQVCTGSAPASPRSLRLLTRQEYQNTVNDLLGLSVSPGQSHE